MKINKLLIKNYKMFKEVEIPVNPIINIFVGDNDSGKSTLLEVIQILLSGKLNNIPFERQLKTSFFNNEIRMKFKEEITKKNKYEGELPSIVLEAYFPDDGLYSEYKGTNNELGENCPGIRLDIEFNTDYSQFYKEMLKNNEIYDIPIEFYKATWRDFGGHLIVFRSFPINLSVIDTTQKDYDSAVNRFINSRITNNLQEDEKLELARAYRKMKNEFNNNQQVLKLNERLSSAERLNDKTIKFGMREQVVDAWMSEVSIDVDNIPFENLGFGTQNIIKMELIFNQTKDKSNVVLFEEPENNLAFGNMSRLISKISSDDTKQVFITTHSSFVANKLGLKNIFLLYKGNVRQLSSVNDETMDFFKKLPGYNTVRFLLAEQVILVEGPTDELIVQKAYKDLHGKLPIEDGIDVMAIGSLAFKRYCELAVLVNKPLTIITDNDGNIEKNIVEKYKEYLDNHSDKIQIYYDENEKYQTIEPSVLAANSETAEDFQKFKETISKDNSLINRNYDEIEKFMRNNKAEWGLRVFDSEKSIKYPKHITNAIKKCGNDGMRWVRKNLGDV